MFNKLLYRIWPWTFSVLTFLAILWLTLGQPPRPDDSLRLWEHTDKIVHAVMFGGFFYVMTLDWYRRRPELKVKRNVPVVWLFFIVAVTAGGVIEIIQPSVSRSADIWDFVADTAGVIIAWLLFPYFIPRSR